MVDRKSRSLASDAGDQLAELKDTLAALGERVSELAAERAKVARRQARSAARSVRGASSNLYDDAGEALSAASDNAVYYGRRAGAVVKANPGISLLGLAIGVGVVAAIVYAAQEDEKQRWYERRPNWF